MLTQFLKIFVIVLLVVFAFGAVKSLFSKPIEMSSYASPDQHYTLIVKKEPGLLDFPGIATATNGPVYIIIKDRWEKVIVDTRPFGCELEFFDVDVRWNIAQKRVRFKNGSLIDLVTGNVKC